MKKLNTPAHSGGGVLFRDLKKTLAERLGYPHLSPAGLPPMLSGDARGGLTEDTHIANRYLFQFRYSLESSIVDIYAKVAIGAAGAPTLNTAQSKGVSSIVRNSAGRYTITFQDSYVRTMAAKGSFIVATTPASPNMSIVSDNIATLATPTVVVQFSTGGVATDPASGETALLQFSFKNSSS